MSKSVYQEMLEDTVSMNREGWRKQIAAILAEQGTEEAEVVVLATDDQGFHTVTNG